MSPEQATGFTIEYYASDELKATDSHPGPLSKTEAQAIIGMIKHLFLGVDCARVLDASGQEINVIRAPVSPIQ